MRALFATFSYVNSGDILVGTPIECDLNELNQVTLVPNSRVAFCMPGGKWSIIYATEDTGITPVPVEYRQEREGG